MIDYELKSNLLKTDVIKVACKLHKGFYLNHYQNYRRDIYIPDIKLLQELKDMYFGDNDKYYQECIKIANATYKRNTRLKQNIMLMLMQGQCYFLTLTFSNDVLNNTTTIARRRRVRDFLNANYKDYIANIDYGDINDREHYHAIVLYDKPVNYYDWYNPTYRSRINAEPIHIREDSIESLTKYINKLTNHAIKESTKRNAIIYKRKVAKKTNLVVLVRKPKRETPTPIFFSYVQKPFFAPVKQPLLSEITSFLASKKKITKGSVKKNKTINKR